MTERSDLLAANASFYRILASGDAAAMERIWAPEGKIVCVHPGWGILSDRDLIMDSWRAIMQAPPPITQHNPMATVEGSLGFVVCEERIDDDRIAATNIFRHDGKQWLLVHHQAGQVLADMLTEDEEEQDEDEDDEPTMH